MFAAQLRLAASRVAKYNDQRSRLGQEEDDPGPYALQGFQRAVCVPGYPFGPGQYDSDEVE